MGLSEADQGRFAGRMVNDIYDARCAGGMLFTWQDGWWKSTWILANRTFPRERFSIWHDMLSAQEHYGLLAFDPPAPGWQPLTRVHPGSALERVWARTNAEFFSIRIELGQPLAPAESITIGLDTYDDELGESLLPDGTDTRAVRSEFALTIRKVGPARLQVMRSYDLYHLRKPELTDEPLRSTRSDAGDWVDVRLRMSWDRQSDDEIYAFSGDDFALGELRTRVEPNPPSSLDAVTISNTQIEVRLPWNILHFADPSTRTVVHDDRGTLGVMESRTSEGIALVVVRGKVKIETGRISWSGWDEAPATTERLKNGAAVFAQALGALPNRFRAPTW